MGVRDVRTCDSELFGKIPAPNTFDDILRLASQRNAHSRSVRIWRGQADIAWPIHSTGYRRLAISWRVSGGAEPIESDMCSYESSLLKMAEHRGYRQYEGRALSDFQVLARLRHHGAATRLVDATRNVLVALWFCAASEPQKSGLLLGVHTDCVGGYEGGLHMSEDDTYDNVVNGISGRDYPMTWEPPSITPRVAAQHSQFLYSAITSAKSGSLSLPWSEDDVLAMSIAPDLKIKCLEILSSHFDITRTTLFPDLEGFGAANGCLIDTSANMRW